MRSPGYSYPAAVLMGLARDIVLGRRRELHRDAKACIDRLSPPVHILGEENIPPKGPCVITVNHYHRSGFRAQWILLAISAVVPANVHWVITGELTYLHRWYGSPGVWASQVLLRRIASVYGFTNMPPMPPRPEEVERRARSVRLVLEYVRESARPVLGLAPEGHDSPAAVLRRPPNGAGRFALLLARAGVRFVPVGLYEAEGVLHLRFGEHYELYLACDLPARERDWQAAEIVMRQIACLLPEELRGEFA